jgi:hypothetical protein
MRYSHVMSTTKTKSSILYVRVPQHTRDLVDEYATEREDSVARAARDLLALGYVAWRWMQATDPDPATLECDLIAALVTGAPSMGAAPCTAADPTHDVPLPMFSDGSAGHPTTR